MNILTGLVLEIGLFVSIPVIMLIYIVKRK